jgi:hypothetical protein
MSGQLKSKGQINVVDLKGVTFFVNFHSELERTFISFSRFENS